MQRFEGQQDFPQGADELWHKLSDARFLVGCIPDVEQIAQQDADRAVLVVRPGFSFVRGSLDTTLQRTAAEAPHRVSWHLTSRGIGSSSEVEANLEIVPEGAGSRVRWVIEVKTLGGLLKMVPAGLIRGAAQKVIADAWAALASRLAAPEGS
jgi:carbon monoxide dehydrogenase subunit G